MTTNLAVDELAFTVVSSCLLPDPVERWDRIFDGDTTCALIDFDESVCVLLIAVMHFIGPHDHPGQIVKTYRSQAAPGS